MSKPKFTRGEWIATNYGYEKWSVNGINGQEVCSAWNVNNAHLIAAAPNYYSEVESLLSNSSFAANFPEEFERLDRLQAKARGEHE